MKTEDGITYVDDLRLPEDTSSCEIDITAILSGEIGGLNCIAPLVVGADLGLPVLDCDGMGRAFPELQMFLPFISGINPYPVALADDKGRKAAVLYVDRPKHMEDHFRQVMMNMGCSGGITF
mgnify:FL=1